MIRFDHIRLTNSSKISLEKMKSDINDIINNDGYFIKERSKPILSIESIDAVIDMISKKQLSLSGPDNNFIENLYNRIINLVLKYSKAGFSFSNYTKNLATKITNYIIGRIRDRFVVIDD